MRVRITYKRLFVGALIMMAIGFVAGATYGLPKFDISQIDGQISSAVPRTTAGMATSVPSAVVVIATPAN